MTEQTTKRGTSSRSSWAGRAKALALALASALALGYGAAAVAAGPAELAGEPTGSGNDNGPIELA